MQQGEDNSIKDVYTYGQGLEDNVWAPMMCMVL